MRAHKQGVGDCLWALCVYTNHFANLGNSLKTHFGKMDLLSHALFFYRNSVRISHCTARDSLIAEFVTLSLPNIQYQVMK